MHVESTLLINATVGLIYISILDPVFKQLGYSKGKWISNTRCIMVVRRDTQKCCTKTDQGKLTRAHALTHLTSMPSNTRYLHK